MNPKCGWSRGHATKDCWFKGGASAHKAPKWWKEKQAKRTSKTGKSANANVAKEAKGSTETANVSVKLDKPLGDHFQDGYESYPSICVDEDDVNLSKKWSGNWEELTTTLELNTSCKSLKPSEEEVCATVYTQLPYCINSGCTSHCSPV